MYTWCMIQEFCLQRYDWIFRCMFRKYSKKLFIIIIYCHMTYAKGAKHLCTTAAANALAIHLRQRGLEKNRWNFMIWAVFFAENTCMQGYIYIYKWKRNWFQWSFPNPNVPRYNAMPLSFWNKSCLPPYPKKKGVESERSPIFLYMSIQIKLFRTQVDLTASRVQMLFSTIHRNKIHI